PAPLVSRFRPGPGPTLLTLAALAILIGLGLWQLQRLDWKTALLDEIDARMDQPAVALPARIDDPARWRYRPVRLTGRFDHAREQYVFSGRRGGGWMVYTPLIRDAGPPVLVNRGLVPDDRRAPETRPQSQPEGPVSVTGIARLSRPGGWLVPAPEPATRSFYAADRDALAAAMGLAPVAPVMVDAETRVDVDMAADGEAGGPDPLPRGGQTRVDIPNDHLEYALTWFALALVLLGVYIAYGFSRRAPGQP
ncbi:SURF1 family protein, partial [Rhodothalassium salexigens]